MRSIGQLCRGVCFSTVLYGCGGSVPGSAFFPAERLSAQPLLIEQTNSNELRVLALNSSGVELGQCATLSGGVVNRLCVDGPEGRIPVDRTTRPDLGRGQFRIYSRLVSVESELRAGGGAGGVGVNASGRVVVSRHEMVLEWGRYRLQRIPVEALLQTRAPLVSAVEVGFAVRIVFNVELRSNRVEASANFGLAQLATALASNEAKVSVRYDTVGTTVDLLPERSPTNISSVDALLDAENGFYQAVRDLSLHWQAFASRKPATGTETGADASERAPGGTLVDVRGLPQGAAAYQFEVVSYYATGLPAATSGANAQYAQGYVAGMRAISNGENCELGAKHFPAQSEYVAGFSRAYSDIMALHECSSTNPSDEQRAAASSALAPPAVIRE